MPSMNPDLKLQNFANSKIYEFFSEILCLSKKNHKKFHFHFLAPCFEEVAQTNKKLICTYFHLISSTSFQFSDVKSNEKNSYFPNMREPHALTTDKVTSIIIVIYGFYLIKIAGYKSFEK